MSSEDKIRTYKEFWPYYLAEHSKPMTKLFHLFGTLIATATMVWSVINGKWFFIAAAIVVGYAFAWTSHFFIEKNRPATFKYPLWSFLSDYRMAVGMLMFRKF